MQKAYYFRNLTFLFLCSLIICCAYHEEQKVPKIKQERVASYYYRMGKPSELISFCDTTTYDLMGNPLEELSSGKKGVYNYERDTLLTSFTKYNEDGSIYYKRNINYDNKGRKTMLKIYQRFSSTNTPELIAGMKFYYNDENRVSEKVYFGAIKYNEEESIEVVSLDDTDILGRERKRQADSTKVSYIYNKNGTVNHIIFNNDSNYIINYQYNANGKIVSKIGHPNLVKEIERLSVLRYISGKKNIQRDSYLSSKLYYYANGKLSKTEEVTFDGFTTFSLFNDKGKITEIQCFTGLDQQVWRNVYTYSPDGLLKEVIIYNEINEPERIDRYEYDLY